MLLTLQLSETNEVHPVICCPRVDNTRGSTRNHVPVIIIITEAAMGYDARVGYSHYDHISYLSVAI